MISIIIILYIVISVLFCLVEYKKNYITPSLIWVVFQIIMFVGICLLYDNEKTSDKNLIFIYFISLILFILGDEFGKKIYVYKTIQCSEQLHLSYNLYMCVIIIAIISIIACAIFFIKAGQNAFLLLLSSWRSNTIVETVEVRRSINFTKGSGYIYQIRVYILPLLCMYLLLYEKGKRKYWGVALLPFMIIYLLGSGQRAGMIMVVLMTIISYLLYLHFIKNNEKTNNFLLNKIIIVIVIALGIIFFVILSVSNNRIKEKGSYFSEFTHRIFNSNQYCALIAYRYIENQPIQWGKDWYEILKGIIGKREDRISLASNIYFIIYNSYKGTSPPCKWGSLYYNWGYWGIFIMPLFYGIISRYLYYRLFKKRITLMRLHLYGSLFVVYGTWIADAPVYLIIQGIAAISLLLFIFDNNLFIKDLYKKKK